MITTGTGGQRPGSVGFTGIRAASLQAAVKAKAKDNFAKCLEEIDGLLKGRKWTIGSHYTIVDAYLLVFYRWGNRNALPVKQLGNYTALMDRVLARPAVKKVMADEGITLD